MGGRYCHPRKGAKALVRRRSHRTYNDKGRVGSSPPFAAVGDPEIEAGALFLSVRVGFSPPAPHAMSNRGNSMTNFISSFVRDETGAAAAEYALILAIVGTGIAAAAIALGGSITTAMNTAGTCMTTKGKTC